ncbi:TonB-dependent receptor [Shewanella mesophila]|uniref:TonB-dependent receptor n=1 Tax=Shewanella mesophila TaxID=2864208 RepID=UPI001C66007C|nr:TonB-dependent receptor [Shewanella mesophila]QYJ85399.1 TonB-dependent receptor [Shewanella mesophila]
MPLIHDYMDMAASHDHGQLVTHAHIIMIGFLLSFSYALCYRLWQHRQQGSLVTAQLWLHQLGTIGVTSGLFLLYGEWVVVDLVDPFLAVSSFSVFGGVLVMLVQIITSSGKAQA